jgi:hypothetical protein
MTGKIVFILWVKSIPRLRQTLLREQKTVLCRLLHVQSQLPVVLRDQ